jgi:mRNA-degrading endonuclease RelE of RelBE toxin-antitoxin system
MFTITETQDFGRQWPQYWNEADYDSFIEFIAANPTAGSVVPQSGGVRKVRWCRPGSGKSSGVRVVYFIRNPAGKIVLLAIYAKARTANMTADKLKELRRDYEKITPPQR